VFGAVAAPSGFATADGWWRPQAAVRRRVADVASGNEIAFRALVAFTAILLLSPQAWFPILAPLRIAFLAAGLAIGAHLFDRIVRRGSAPPVNAEIVLAILLVSWAIITVPVSYWAGGSVEILTDQYIKAIAFFWLVGTLATSASRMRILAWTLVLCAIPLAATGIKNYISGELLYTGVPGLRRIYGYMGGSGLAANPNDLALVLNLIIPIAAALMLESRTLGVRLVAAFSMLISIACVVVTFSRAGFLTLATTAAMLFVVLLRRKSAGAAAALLLLVLAAPVLMPAGYMDRVSTITNIEADRTGSAQGRWEDFVLAAEVVATNPIVGVGVGNDMIALNRQRGEETWRSVHNAYLQYAVDLGLPGLVLFAWMHVLCFRNARDAERRALRNPELWHLSYLAAGIQVSLAAFFVAAMFHPIAYQFYFFTIAGLAVALKNTCRTELIQARQAITATRGPEGPPLRPIPGL
jgi:probable O-glycosylation ligase (exosortase A-associated)